VPLRNLARTTMPEEKFHAQFGKDFGAELVKTPEGKAALQAAVDAFYPYAPHFFGASKSKNNEIFRSFGIKLRTNEDMRADYVARAKDVLDSLGLKAPVLAQAA
jgi:ring-1,2-phenylacetyl-CoA epoxidase subunit PaaA